MIYSEFYSLEFKDGSRGDWKFGFASLNVKECVFARLPIKPKQVGAPVTFTLWVCRSDIGSQKRCPLIGDANLWVRRIIFRRLQSSSVSPVCFPFLGRTGEWGAWVNIQLIKVAKELYGFFMKRLVALFTISKARRRSNFWQINSSQMDFLGSRWISLDERERNELGKKKDGTCASVAYLAGCHGDRQAADTCELTGALQHQGLKWRCWKIAGQDRWSVRSSFCKTPRALPACSLWEFFGLPVRFPRGMHILMSAH